MKNHITVTMRSGGEESFFIEKGTIDSASLDMVYDERFLSFNIGFMYDDGGGQFMTGIHLGNSMKDASEPHVIDLLKQVNELFGTTDWNQLKGRKAWAIKDKKGFQGRIIGIAVPDGGYWFMDQWRKDNFPSLEELKHKDLPMRYERQHPSKRNRLETVE